MNKNKTKLILTIFFIWHLLIFIKLPHLTWLPGFLNTWFYDKGLILYKDIADPHFPFSYVLMHPFLKLTNWNLQTDPILALGVAILSCFGIYYFGRRVLTTIGLIISLTFFSVFYWYFSTWVQISQEGIQGLLIIPLVFFLLKPPNKLSPTSTFLFGFYITFLWLTGQIITPLILISVAIFIYFYRSYIISFISGLLVPLTLISLYFFSKGAFNDFFFWNIPYYINYAKLNQNTSGNLPWFDILTFFSPIILLFILIKNKGALRRTSIILSLLALSAIPTIIFSVFHPHHFLLTLPLLSTSAGYAVSNLIKIKKIKFITVSIVFLICLYLTLQIIPLLVSKFIQGWNPNILTANIDRDQQQTLEWIKINTPLSTRILVAGDPLFYYRSDRLPANNRFSVLPWHYLPLNKTQIVITKNPPSFWIIDKHYIQRLIYGWKTPQIAQFIKDELICYKIVFENQQWEIWQRTCD